MFRGSILVAFLALALSGCQTARFYSQAIGGQWEMLNRRRPIDQVLADDATQPDLARQLQLVRALCDFAARELHLPADGQYTRYADLRRPFVVWNVHAAPEFSLEAKSWWYPIVGRLEYQGYFDKTRALEYGRRLKADGLDVFVGGVEAYSTLGWFNDPVLNTFVHLPEADLADLVFHELAHRRLFIPGDTDFNEAFATAVAREGVRRWLTAKSDPTALARYLELRRGDDAVVEIILFTRRRLADLYGRSETVPAEPMRQAKADIIAEMRTAYRELQQRLPDYHEYDAWMAAPVNNAQFNTIDTYYQLVPAFDQLLEKTGGDLTIFYDELTATRRLTQEERRHRINAGRQLADQH